MSRLPPQIEQVVQGRKVEGVAIVPITEAGVTYTPSRRTRPDGFDLLLTATDKTGTVVWEAVYFSCTYDTEPGLETDVQDVFPLDLFIDGDDVVVKVEYDRFFHLNRKTGAVHGA